MMEVVISALLMMQEVQMHVQMMKQIEKEQWTDEEEVEMVLVMPLLLVVMQA